MKKVLSLLLFAPLLFLQSCYPVGADSVSDLDVVVTHYTPGFDFSNKPTYAIIDSVVNIGDQSSGAHPFDSDIIARVKSNLNRYGYTELDTASTPAGTKPDFLVRVSNLSIEETETYCSYYPDYGWGWWGGWGYWYGGYPGYGYGYSWCGYGYTYEIGTVVIEMVDLSQAGTSAEELDVAWMALLNGVASSSTINDRDRVLRGINKAFDQSEYLNQ